MLAACAGWQKKGILADLDVHLVTPHDGLLGLEPADSRVAPYVEQYGITVHERSVVPDVDEATRSVTLGGWDTSVLTEVTLAYVTRARCAQLSTSLRAQVVIAARRPGSSTAELSPPPVPSSTTRVLSPSLYATTSTPAVADTAIVGFWLCRA